MDKQELQEKYIDGILEYNKNINLTAIKDKEEAMIKHVIDSLSIVDFPEYISAKEIIDIGTGGGFPGVPLAINNPEKEFVLMDALKKRLNVIDELTSSLGISNVTTLHGRAEDIGQDKKYRENFDLVVSRAVSSMPVLLEYCLPLVKVGGYFIAYKGDSEEQYKNALKILGGELVEVRDSKMEKYGISHSLIVIKKVKETLKVYPRRAGMVEKKPII